MKAFIVGLIVSSFLMPTFAAVTDLAKDNVAEEAVIAAQALTDNKESVQTLKESEIPVHLDTAKKASSGESSFYKILAALGVLGIMACGAYFFIRKYMQTAGKNTQATQIKILTQHYLGPKKSLAIIRVAGESILVGITDSNINLIKSLSLLDEEIPEETALGSQGAFNNVFAKTGIQEPSEDDFAMTGIKDFVSSKLKNMRNIE